MFRKNIVLKSILLTLGGFVVTPFAFAETFDPAIDGLIRNQQRQAELEKIIQPERDVNLDVAQKKEAVKLTDIEDQNCFEIKTIELHGEMSQQFDHYVQQALKDLSFTSGLCMGEQRINLLMTQTQNIIIGRGFTTTRILAAPQNLSMWVQQVKRH